MLGPMDLRERDVATLQQFHCFQTVNHLSNNLIIVKFVEPIAGVGRNLRSYCKMSGWRTLICEVQGKGKTVEWKELAWNIQGRVGDWLSADCSNHHDGQ